MTESKNILHVFTAEYPYGKVSETFLETEILFLSKGFSKVVIYPSKTLKTQRPVPENVIIDRSIANLSMTRGKKLTVLIKNFLLVLSILSTEVRTKGFFKVVQNNKLLFDILSLQFTKKEQLEKSFSKNESHLLYSYWFCDTLMPLCLIKLKNSKIKIVSRAHGYDLYDERNPKIGIPFRLWKMKQIDRLYLISEYGKKYMASKIPSIYHSKLKLSRLGAIPIPNNITKSGKELVFISISRVIPFKNIDKIPFLLSSIDQPLRWIHFGDGPGMKKVKKACENLTSSLQIELKGQVPNEELLDWLSKNHVDFLICLSSSEGLPVSMMEVQSLGIPILSTPVGGIPEIVINDKTGYLLDLKDTELNREILIKAINTSFDRWKIIEFYNKHFNANVNYTNFTNELCLGRK